MRRAKSPGPAGVRPLLAAQAQQAPSLLRETISRVPEGISDDTMAISSYLSYAKDLSCLFERKFVCVDDDSNGKLRR